MGISHGNLGMTSHVKWIPMGILCDIWEKKNNRQNKCLWKDFGVRKKDLFYHKLLICTFMIFVHSQYLHCMYLVEISGFA